MPPMNSRRRALRRLAGAAAAIAAMPGWAAQRSSLTDPMRLAVDDALADSGLAAALQRAFGRDTGVAVKLLRGPATGVLEALERGEHDAALTNAPAVELALDKQGLVHDRQWIVRSDFVLVGPAALAKPLGAGRDMALALLRLAQAQVPFVTRPDGSGTHLAELAAWAAAKIAPAAPWYLDAPTSAPLLAEARRHRACALVERGVWLAQAAPPGYAVLSEGDARLAVDVHAMRTFRSERQHPAGKLFVAWISSAKGRRLAASHRGYQAAKA
jgi:tungstate transport system substrate-binding protein